MMDRDLLPKNWKLVKVSELGKVETGSTPSKSNQSFYADEFPFYKPTDLIAGYNVRKASDNLSELGISKARLLPVNSILITCIGATIGKTGIIRKCGASNQQINAIIPSKDYESNFIYYQTIAPNFQRAIKHNAASTTLPILNKTKFQNLEMVVCSLPEQQKIVAKIEQLFIELDKGKEQLETALQQLKIYRQAVLKWAFEGKLTNKNVKDGELPEGWKWVKLGEMFNFIGGGTPSKEQFDYWNGDVYWASVKDIKGDYLVKTRDSITEKGLKNSASNLALEGDVILITRISPGKSVITKVKTAINQDLKIAKPKFETTSKFIHYFFKAIERECLKKSSGTTVLGITLNNLNELKIPNLQIDIQNQIVQEIESRLSVCDKIEETIVHSLKQAESLRQSILKKAFEGKLVSDVELEDQSADLQSENKDRKKIKV